MKRLPTFVIGGRALKSDTPVEVLCDVIDAALVASTDATLALPSSNDPSEGLDRPPVHLQQILVQWSALADARLSATRTRAQALELARTLLKRAQLPECHFGLLARRFGDGPVDLGVLSPEDMDPSVRRVALKLAVGETSREAVVGEDGIRILRRVG